MSPEFYPAQRDIASIVIALVDACPRPGKIASDPRLEQVVSSLVSFSTAAPEAPPEFTKQVLTNEFDPGEVNIAVIQALRAHGQHVGPWRRRKINAALGTLVNDQT